MSTQLEAALEERIAALPPEKRELFRRRLAREGLGRRAEKGGRGGWTVPRRADGPGPWPLSYGQRRLWFIDRLNPGTPAYNIPFAGRLAGPLRAELLARALAEVIRRHHVLRSRFVEADGRPAQVIDPPPEPRLPLVDLSRLPEAARDAEADRLTSADPQLPFDLARGPVVRMTLLRLAPSFHDLLVTMPHIVTDAWSMAILFRELPALYDAYRHGRASPLTDPPVQVADFALWERERLDGGAGGPDDERTGALGEELDFWRRHLAGAPTVLELPTDRPRPPVPSMRGVRRAVSVPAETTRRVDALADREGATPFMALLASFAAALSRWTGQDDLLLASPLATRSAPEVQGLIGFFIDNAVLRADLSGDPSFRRLLARVRESALATFAHQGVPFEKVAEAVGAGGDLSRPPLAQVNFVLQNVHIPAPEFEELSLVRAQQTDTRSSRFDLALGLFETDGELDGWFEYATDLFDATTVARLERDWLGLLDAALDRPDAPLSALPRLAPPARQQVLVEWNDRPAPFGGELDPWDAGLDELIAGWAARTPDAVAVETIGEERVRSLTFGELDRRAAALAERLRGVLDGVGCGAATEPAVAIELGRVPELAVAVLATWRAGGCYVPIDPALPDARRRWLLDDARPAALVRPSGHGDGDGLDVVPLAEGGGADTGGRGRRPGGGSRLAYLVYTSGSTGEPKGVPVPHRALVRLARGGDFGFLGRGAVAMALAPPSFDASAFGLWVPLAGGARLALLADEMPSVDSLAAAIGRSRTTALVLPAGLFHLLAERRPEALAGVRHVCAGGEAMVPALAARALAAAPDLALHNSYGPTENGIYTTVHRVGRSSGRASVPIGRPVAGTRVAIVDRDLRPVPLGAAGELVTGGAGLARGYHRRPAATAERFIPDSFPDGVGGGRLYRTGDLARWLPDGTLDFLGRADRQVKVRGFRVEPGEVEAALLGHPAVAAAAVVLRDGRLTAYVVGAGADGPRSPEGAALRAFLAERLPDFMVPALVVPLDALPLTPRGKLDRAALPDPRAALAVAEGAEEAPPSSAVEAVLLAVFREVLGVERIGVHDRFFDLGGDSILALRAIARAAEEGIELGPRQLFEHPTIASLARVAERTGAVPRRAHGPVSGPVPLGPAQRWFFERLAPPVPGHWNLALPLEAAASRSSRPDALRLDRLARALAGVVEHHDMLRARFVRGRDGRFRQEVAPPEAVDGRRLATAVDLSGLPPERALAAAADAVAQGQASLDLGSGHLVRLVRLDPPAPEPSRLLLVVHHLVSDAVSLQVLLGDLERLVDAPGSLPPRTSPYRDWTAALEAWAGSPAAEPERVRLRALGNRDEAADDGAPAPREADAETVEAVLPAVETRRLLDEAGEGLRASVEEVVLAAAAFALASPLPSDDGRESAARLRIDAEGHGRTLPEDCRDAAGAPPRLDLSRTVGWFTAVRPVVVEPVRPGDGEGGERGPARTLRAVKDALRASSDGGVGHAAVRWLDPEAPSLPAADLSFNFLGRIDGAAGGAGSSAPLRLAAGSEGSVGPLRHASAPRASALELTAYLRDGELRTVWTYDRTRRRREEVETLAGRALDAVRALTAEDGGPEAEALAASDFPHSGLDRGSLERLLGKLGES